jgi:hypothetical protein
MGIAQSTQGLKRNLGVHFPDSPSRKAVNSKIKTLRRVFFSGYSTKRPLLVSNCWGSSTILEFGEVRGSILCG